MLGVGLTLVFNAVAMWWLGDVIFATSAFYDGSALIVTLALPSFMAGLVVGALARGWAMQTAAVAFGVFCLIGVWHPLWRIPPVSPVSAHSRLLHYFLYNPIVALAFGALGAWFASQFATGRFTLEDQEPVLPQE